MGKYIYLYRGPATSPDEMGAEATAEIMAAWEKWMGSLGPALVDGGAPFGQRTAISDDGSTASASDLNGYTVVEADTLEAAKKHATDHPFLSEGKGRFVLEVFELVPM
jgi:hypothetical protein